MMSVDNAYDLIFRIAGFGIIVSVITEVLDRSGHGQYKQPVIVLSIVFVLSTVVYYVSSLFNTVKTMFRF